MGAGSIGAIDEYSKLRRREGKEESEAHAIPGSRKCLTRLRSLGLDPHQSDLTLASTKPCQQFVAANDLSRRSTTPNQRLSARLD